MPANKIVKVWCDEPPISFTANAEKIQSTVFIEAVCEGPRCARGKDGHPFKLQWDPEKVKTDPMALPDDAYRLVNFQSFSDPAPHVYCCPRCLLDWLRDFYVVPLSPREIAVQQANNRVVDVARLKKELPVETAGTESGQATLAPGGPEVRDTLVEPTKIYESTPDAPSAS